MKLGKTEDAKLLYQRALYYRNVFNPQDRFFRPRNSDGQWVENFDPAKKTTASLKAPAGITNG